MNYIVYKHIDYLSYTSSLSLRALCAMTKARYVTLQSAKNGYTHALKSPDNGELIMWHDKRADMGTHVVMSGETVQWYRSHGQTDAQIAEMAMMRGKVRRIDVAITSHPRITETHELRPIELLQLDIAGKCRTNIKSRSEVSEHGRIQTVYVGSRKRRKRLFRAYDKGVEMGHVTDWLQRYELQSGGDGSITVAGSVASGADIGQIINRYIEYDHEVWRKIVGAESAGMNHDAGIKKPDTIAWLRDVAAKSLAKTAIEHECPSDVLQWFISVTKQHMRDIVSDGEN